MSNRNNSQYFRLGIFVLLGAASLVALVLIFGARNLFTKTMTIETYIKESVQGLDVGAPVRFRGVRMGQVSYIGLSGGLYESEVPMSERKQYVVVRMQITPPSTTDAEAYLEKMVHDGLRAQIRGQGITGVSTLALGSAIALLANLVTLTPGTTTLDIDMAGHELLVHVLDASDIDGLVDGIRRDFEPGLLALFGPEEGA